MSFLPSEFEYFALPLDHALNHDRAVVGPRFVTRHTLDVPRQNEWPISTGRAQNALAEHSEGCHLLGQVAQGSGTNWSEYFKALYHFEASVAQAYQFYDYASVAPESALA